MSSTADTETLLETSEHISAQPGPRLRIANKYVDGGKGYEFAPVKYEGVLRSTPAGRFQIKATFVEDDRSFQTLTIQKFV